MPICYRPVNRAMEKVLPLKRVRREEPKPQKVRYGNNTQR